MDMFDAQAEETISEYRPLAERMRPSNLDDFVGQVAAVGQGTLLREGLDQDRLFSIIQGETQGPDQVPHGSSPQTGSAHIACVSMCLRRHQNHVTPVR